MIAAPGAPAALRVRGLSRSFGDVRAVSGIDLDVAGGEIFGFLGPNGAGKTTTLRMMCGLLRPDAGTVEVEGVPLGPGRSPARRAVGLSPQSIVIWETLTCAEQLEFCGRLYGLGRAEARRRARDLLETFGLSEKARRLGKTLSGGMQRRLNIALGLVHAPRLLFLDEPQAGLDPQSRVRVREAVRALAPRTTVVLTTHDMEEAEKLCDRVCIIDRGRVLATDTVDGLKSRAGEGDTVEMEVGADVRTELLPFLPGLGPEGVAFRARGPELVLRSKPAADRLPEILATARDRGLALARLRVRPATLEDVFIRLTGRGLRE